MLCYEYQTLDFLKEEKALGSIKAILNPSLARASAKELPVKPAPTIAISNFKVIYIYIYIAL